MPRGPYLLIVWASLPSNVQTARFSSHRMFPQPAHQGARDSQAHSSDSTLTTDSTTTATMAASVALSFSRASNDERMPMSGRLFAHVSLSGRC